MSTPLQSGFSRVFLIDGGARPDHEPEFMSCMRAGSPDQSFGDITNIECPDPASYDQFVVMAEVRGAKSRATVDLVGRYSRDVVSRVLEIARRNCRVDAQVHLGACSDPSKFNTFQKALIFEDAFVSNWSAGDLGALGSDEAAVVDETAPISAADMYEIVPLTLTERAQSVVTNEVLDVVICDSQACGECDVESTGCSHIYAITKAAGGSAGTAADIVHTVDGGTTWYADDIDSLGAAEDPSAVGCLGDYVVVVSNASGSLHYALKTEVDDVDLDETWIEVATGFVAGGEPNDCWGVGRYLYIVGDGGYVYKSSDPTAGVEVLDAGAATTNTLWCVHAYSEDLIVAGGTSGVVIYSTDGASFQACAAFPVGIAVDVTAIWAKNEKVWLAGCSNGQIYYTLDYGENWTLIADWGDRVDDIAFATDSVGYAAYSTSTPRGNIRRTYDGGYSWNILPEGVGTIPANDRVNAVAACPFDPNFVVGVG